MVLSANREVLHQLRSWGTIQGKASDQIIVIYHNAEQEKISHFPKRDQPRDGFWSPDGTRIAFRRRAGQGQNIYVMDTDEQNLRALTESTENPILIGWALNSPQVVFSVRKQGLYYLQMLDVDRGEIQPLITTHHDTLFGISISPDWQWMAYVDSVPGEMAGGIYVARLDGTEKRLLVQLHFLSVSQLLWSPDGKWLAFHVLDNSPMISKSTEGLINVESCQVVPLLNLNGAILGWVK